MIVTLPSEIPEGFASIDEVARLCGCTTVTVHRALQRGALGTLPPTPGSGRAIRLSKDEVKRFCERWEEACKLRDRLVELGFGDRTNHLYLAKNQVAT